MKLVFPLAPLLAIVQASSIVTPAGNAALQASQDVTIQFVVPIDTSTEEVSLVIGLVNCPAAECPAASTDLGDLLFVGKFVPQGTIDNSPESFENFTFTIPSDISDQASIQIQHNFLVTSGHATPTVEYVSALIQVANPTAPPTTSTFNLHPNGNNAKCVDIEAGVYTNGTSVDIFDCDASVSQQWQKVSNAPTSVNPVDGSQWCLDAGVSTLWANGALMKIWQCFFGLAQQTWTFQANNNIQLTNTNFCLDLTNGVLTNQNVLQIWTCSGGNPNQVWTVTDV